MPVVTTMSSPGEVLAQKSRIVLGVGNSQSKWTSPAPVDTWRPLKTFSWESRPKVHQVVLAPPEFRVNLPSSAPHHPTLSEQLWIKVPAQFCTFQLQDQCNCATCATSAARSDGFPALFSHAPGPWTQHRPSKQFLQMKANTTYCFQ